MFASLKEREGRLKKEGRGKIKERVAREGRRNQEERERREKKRRGEGIVEDPEDVQVLQALARALTLMTLPENSLVIVLAIEDTEERILNLKVNKANHIIVQQEGCTEEDMIRKTTQMVSAKDIIQDQEEVEGTQKEDKRPVMKNLKTSPSQRREGDRESNANQNVNAVLSSLNQSVKSPMKVSSTAVHIFLTVLQLLLFTSISTTVKEEANL